MTTEADLLAAIDADPIADAPRLAHADFVEASGDAERAAFIRQRLYERRVTSHPWYGRLPQAQGMTWECNRGLPEGVRFDSLAAFHRGWPLTSGHRVRHVAFAGVRSPAKLAAEPALASIQSLELAGIPDDGVAAVLRSPHLAALRRLEVGPHYPADGNFLRRLLDLPVLDRLDGLAWHFYAGDGLPADAVADFFSSPRIRGLRELVIDGWLGPDAMRLLLASPHLAGLRVLEFGRGGGWNSTMQAGNLDALGDGAALAGLERLRYRYHLGAQMPAHAVARATSLTRLRVLDLCETPVGDAGAVALADAPHLAALERLELASDRLGDSGAVAIAHSRNLRSLTHFDLRHTLVGRTGIAAFGRTTALPRLRTLRLQGTPAPAEFAAAVEARFRDGGPPVEEAAPRVEAPMPTPDIPVVGDVDEAALVRAILSDPFDDVSRLVYADWLEEHGSPEYAAALRAEGDARAALVPALREAMDIDAPGYFKISLGDEGLLRVTLPLRVVNLKSFAARGPAWLRRHHVLEVTPTDNTSKWRDVFSAARLGGVRGLNFRGRHFAAWDALAASPELPSLAALTVGDDRHDEPALGAFLRTADLRGLCLLRRPAAFFGPELFAALTASPVAGQLRNWYIAGLRDDGLAELTESPAFAELVTLTVHLRDDAAAKILADARGLAGLRNLDVSLSSFGEAGVEALAGSRLLQRLRRLGVRGTYLEPSSLRRLADAMPSGSTLALGGRVSADRRAALEGAGCRVVIG